MKLYEKLNKIQTLLKAPKDLYNSFGKYKYRNCEGILEAVKPHLTAFKCILTISDEIEQIGERYYVKAVATLIDCEDGEQIVVKAYARESETKKGMDDSQVTGATSSYARKYALNGLFLLDDTKDADDEKSLMNDHNQRQIKTENEETIDYRKVLVDYCIANNLKLTDVSFQYNLKRGATNEEYKKVYDSIIGEK